MSSLNKVILLALVLCGFRGLSAQNALIKQGGVLLNGTATGQVARWNGSNWLAAEPTVLSAAPLTGNGTTATPLTLADGTNAGDVLKWNGTTWAPATDAGTTYTAGTGIDVTGTVISNTGDLSNSNEGSLTVGAGTASTSIINSNTTGSTGVTLSAGANVAITESGNTITIAASSGPGTDLSVSGTSSPLTINSSSGADLTLTAGSNIALAGTSSSITITATEVDGLTDNEGLLGVGAGSSTTSVVTTNTIGGTGVTFSFDNNLSVTETTGSNGGTISVVGPRVREEVFVATANQTNFTLTGPAYAAPSGTVQQLLVYRNGVLLKYAASAPTITQFTYSANVVTTAACALGDDIVIRYIQP
jgi:hypothetical protein